MAGVQPVQVAAWPRPQFTSGGKGARTTITFVCFGKAPLADMDLSRSRFGLPDAQLLNHIDVREHQRAASGEWFENWWAGAFGVHAAQVRYLGTHSVSLPPSLHPASQTTRSCHISFLPKHIFTVEVISSRNEGAAARPHPHA